MRSENMTFPIREYLTACWPIRQVDFDKIGFDFFLEAPSIFIPPDLGGDVDERADP
jgi:hypothetical protein